MTSLLDTAMTHLNAICDLGGRLAGTDSERRAIDLALRILSDGGGNVRQRPVLYDGWQAEPAWITACGHRHAAVALPGCSGLPAGQATLRVIDAGRGTPNELDALASRLQGRAVLVRHEYMFAPDHIHRCKKSARALDHGAALFIIANTDACSGPVTGGIFPAMPAIGVDSATADALSEASLRNDPVDVSLCARRQPMRTRTLDLLIPSRTGADAPEIILCAHIDGHAISESAMDNASGAAVVLALAKYYRRDPLTNYALRILIFSAEEIALCGSDAYVAGLSPVLRDKIRAVINLDCVAGDAVFGAITNGFDDMADLSAKAGAAQGINMQIHNRLVRNSDHHAFAAAGIPALRLTAGYGQADSRLRYVLTGRDRRDLIEMAEMDRALALTREMIRLLDNSARRV